MSDPEQSEVLGVSLMACEFPTAMAASQAFEDLHRWTQKRDRISAYRLADGSRQIIVAVFLTEDGYAKALSGRFRRKGGAPCDIPEADRHALVERTIRASAQGLQDRRSYEIALPLLGQGSDSSLN